MPDRTTACDDRHRHVEVFALYAPRDGQRGVHRILAAEDELERGRARAESAFVYRLQSLGGSGGKADQLNSYNVFRGGPDYFDADLARYLSASRDSVHDAVRRFIDPARAIELTVVPRA